METGAVSVLVVDDEPSLRLLCRVNLELDGFSVLEAGTVGEARQTLGSRPIEVVILDVHVGTGDGRQLLAGSGPGLRHQGADADGNRRHRHEQPRRRPGDGEAFDPAELVSTVRELAGVDKPANANGDSAT